MTKENFQPFGVEHVKAQKPEYSADGAWVCAGPPEDIPSGKAITLHLPRFRIAVFHIKKNQPHGGDEGEAPSRNAGSEGATPAPVINGFFAIKDACPHASFPLSKGIVCGESVTCASHGWKFNLRTGCGERGEPTTDIRTFPVEIRDGKIWVKIL